MFHKTASEFFDEICDLNSMEKVALNAFCDNYFGELFVEYREDEMLKLESGMVHAPCSKFKRGFGLRACKDEMTKYSYSSILDTKSVSEAVGAINTEEHQPICLQKNAKNLYTDRYILGEFSLDKKISFLKEIDNYARSKSDSVTQVIAILAGSWQVVSILNERCEKYFDIRPMVRLSVSIIVEKDGVAESGSYSGGGRLGYETFITDETKIKYVNEAVQQACVKMRAIKAPVGEMPVVLGNGWTGILLHEAVGHALESDSVRKKTSSFCNLFGETVASKNITIVDDGTIEHKRGSINIDDEGSASQRNVLIENGTLVGCMQDRQNAKLMNANITGNGRRESYETPPLPRMTNTFMLPENNTFDEIVSSVKNGIFAKTFSDGQVDVASGKFVFSSSEAYLIENGKITTPIKGAMLIGDGPSILKKISMIGNDFALDTGVGTCGKDSQWVPVGVGQPSVLIDKITVGGANL